MCLVRFHNWYGSVTAVFLLKWDYLFWFSWTCFIIVNGYLGWWITIRIHIRYAKKELIDGYSKLWDKYSTVTRWNSRLLPRKFGKFFGHHPLLFSQVIVQQTFNKHILSFHYLPNNVHGAGNSLGNKQVVPTQHGGEVFWCL